MLISTVLGRFVIPIYYVLGERISQWFQRGRTEVVAAEHESNEPGEEKEPARQ